MAATPVPELAEFDFEALSDRARAASSADLEPHRLAAAAEAFEADGRVGSRVSP